MNAATRQAARYCLSRGHTPLGIYNGIEGLLDGSVSELSWLRVDNWTTRGGSELGTNRTLPSIDIGGVAVALQRHEIHALFIIGGFEAYSSVTMLEKGRKEYPALRIPMIHLPATLSNNVPLTDFSLGSDTSLNVLVEAVSVVCLIHFSGWLRRLSNPCSVTRSSRAPAPRVAECLLSKRRAV